MWICYLYGGVSFLKDGNLTNYGEPEGLPPGRVRKFAKDEEGTIWAAVQGGLALYDGSRWQRVGLEWNYPGKMAQVVFVDKEGTLWVATEDTIVFLPKGTRSFQPTGEKIDEVLEITEAPDRTMWMAETTGSVRRIRLPGIDARSAGPEIEVGSRRIVFDREGSLWVPSAGDGIRRLPYPDRFPGQRISKFSDVLEKFTEAEGLSANYIFTVFEDREGNIWIGTANGLDRFRASSFVPVRFPPGYHDFGLAAGHEGEIWTGSPTTGVHRIRGSIPTSVEPDLEILFVFNDDEGSIWMGGNNGIHRWYKDTVSMIELPPGLKLPGLSAVFTDGSGILWIYVDQVGAFQYRDGSWTQYDKQSDLPKSSPLTGTVDSLDRKWLGYAANKLAVLDGRGNRTFSQDDGLQVGDVKAIQERHGRLWVGGSLGLAVYENDRFRMLTAEEAGALSGVSGIVGSRDGSLWLNAERGVIHIPADEVRFALGHPAHKVRYRVFDYLDGLPGAAQQNRPFPTAAEGSDGRLWFSTNKGIAWLDPQQIPQNNTPPPVSIRSLTADEKLYEPLPSIELPEGTTGLQIDFTALSLSIPERIHFRYRLEGVDAGWQEAGTRRQAFYNSLAPGSYQFRVIASNEDGVWNEDGAILEFSIAPMFYQTLWFRSLTVLLALLFMIGTVILLYRWRLARATKHLKIGFEERLAERTRIAHGLHDTLLQGFFGAAMRLQAVSNLLPAKSETAKENLDDVLDQIDVVLEEGRRAIWDMNALSIGENDLTQAFMLVGEDLNKSYPTDFILTIEGESRRLNPIIRDQTYRIGREALTNAFRHARAGKIELTIEYAQKYLRIAVRDNGCGISTDYISEGREGHLGLSGMREYAEKIGAELKIWSRSESGTEVELIVPHKIAFM
jgi:signal transduction histidine kinase/ligand-binding sensor domain-containing protein